MQFKWKDEFSVNVEEIDKQHKKLFEIGGRIADVVSVNDSYDHYDEIMEIFGELVEYTVYHFGYEEGLMKQYGYEGAETHEVEHAFFIKKLKRVKPKDVDEKQREVMEGLVSFVYDWITGHILETDFKYRDFFKRAGLTNL